MDEAFVPGALPAKRDAQGIPGDRYTEISGVQKHDSAANDAVTVIKDNDQSTIIKHITGETMNKQNTTQHMLRRQWTPPRPGELRRWRDAQGWTQKRMVAEITKHLSPDPGTLDLETYQAWEHGTAQPSKPEAYALRQVFEEYMTPQDYTTIAKR